MKFITVNDDMYAVRGTVLADKVTRLTSIQLKNQYSLADTVLRNGDKLYICMKILDAEFEDIKQYILYFDGNGIDREMNLDITVLVD